MITFLAKASLLISGPAITRANISTRQKLIIFIGLVLAQSLTRPAHAQPSFPADTARSAADHQPKICTGFVPFADDFTYLGSSRPWDDPQHTSCPPNQAIFSAMPYLKRDISGSEAKFVGLVINCCPLPANDILTKGVTYSNSNCPPGSIATGASVAEILPECAELQEKSKRTKEKVRFCNRRHSELPKRLHCTKVNTDRYQLATPEPAYRRALSGHIGSLQDTFTTWAAIPLGLRYGLGRMSQYDWRDPTCVAYPWGGILVGKLGKGCRYLRYSQLQFRGLKGDPPQGTPVKMFPDCIKIENPESKTPRCIPMPAAK